MNFADYTTLHTDISLAHEEWREEQVEEDILNGTGNTTVSGYTTSSRAWTSVSFGNSPIVD